MGDEGSWKGGGASPPVQRTRWGRRRKGNKGMSEIDKLMFDAQRWGVKTARLT